MLRPFAFSTNIQSVLLLGQILIGGFAVGIHIHDANFYSIPKDMRLSRIILKYLHLYHRAMFVIREDNSACYDTSKFIPLGPFDI